MKKDKPRNIETFFRDQDKLKQWQAFVRKSKLETEGMDLEQVAEVLRNFVMPPVEALTMGAPLNCKWPTSGPWTSSPATT